VTSHDAEAVVEQAEPAASFDRHVGDPQSRARAGVLPSGRRPRLRLSPAVDEAPARREIHLKRAVERRGRPHPVSCGKKMGTDRSGLSMTGSTSLS